MDQWHLWFGHHAHPVVSRVIKSNKLPVSPSQVSSILSSCQQGKSHRLHFSSSSSISSNPLQLLFFYVYGHTPLNSINNKCFYLSMVDDFSKDTWFFPFESKYDVHATFMHFKTLVEMFFNTKIILVQSDNGGEFRPLQSALTTMVVSYHLSCPHTRHQMGSVERKHRHTVKLAYPF
jgi:hypothetical protein